MSDLLADLSLFVNLPKRIESWIIFFSVTVYVNVEFLFSSINFFTNKKREDIELKSTFLFQQLLLNLLLLEKIHLFTDITRFF